MTSRPEHLLIRQAGEEYPAIGERHFRRLVSERRIAYSKVGGKVILLRSDIEALLDAGRVEPSRGPIDLAAARRRRA
jgi:hypothetical protein